MKQAPERIGKFGETGIYVRAQDINGKWISCDIADLTRDSLFQWLRSRGGENPYAENVVGLLLGHVGGIVPPTPDKSGEGGADDGR